MTTPIENSKNTPLLPPRSRSGGRISAVSSGRSTRRRPRPALTKPGSTGRGLPPGVVDAARRELWQQRAFRVNQLTQLDAARPAAENDAVRDDVHAQLRAGAEAVLSDIDSALRRIEHGTYGCCADCGEPMSLRRLTALPMASRCGSCQRVKEMEATQAHDQAPAPRSR